jgi:hypothetical protein
VLKLKIILVLHRATNNYFLKTTQSHTVYRVEAYTAAHKSHWDDFVNTAKNGTFLFRRDFMEYHSERFQDASQLIFKGEQLVGVLPANQSDAICYSHQGLTYGGLVLSRKAKLSEVVLMLQALLISLEAKGFKQLQLKQLPIFYTSLPSEELEYLAFVCKATISRVDTASVIDNRQRIAIQPNRKEGVKKAKRQGLRIEEAKEFTSFWKEILEPNLSQRHDAAPTHSLEEITQLAAIFPKQIRQFNVLKEQTLVGGATIFETATTAHVQYISANAQKQALGTLDFLFAYLIEDVFADKNYFDFGISNESGGRKLNTGLNYWKECFGARTYVHRFYEFDTASHRLLDDLSL